MHEGIKIVGIKIVAGCGLLLIGAAGASAQRASDRPAPADMMAKDGGMAQASEDMARAATNLWVALTPEQQAKAGFSFDDTKERTNWHFIPRDRKGLTWNDMD